MSGLELRSLGLADVDSLATLERRCFPDPWSKDQLTGTVSAPGFLGTGAFDGPGLAGAALWRLLPDGYGEPAEVELLRIAVESAHRRRHLGSRLLTTSLRALRERRVTTGWLEVMADDNGALAFYRATGWLEAGRRRRYFRNGADALMLRLSIR